MSNPLLMVGALGNPIDGLLQGLFQSRGISNNSALAQMNALNAQRHAMDNAMLQMCGINELRLGVPTKNQGRCAYCATKQPTNAIHCDSCGAPQ